jgi:DNA-binding transcriptional LysR family regulator
VGLDVQVLPAHGAETGTVRTAEDLVRELERDRVACPRAQPELVVRDVLRVQLVGNRRVGIMELAGDHLSLDLGVPEAPHAGAAQVHAEPHVEERRTGRLRDLELHGDRPGRRLVALPAEHEGLDLDVVRLASDLARAQAKGSQIDGGHELSVTAWTGARPTLALLFGWYLTIMESDRWLGLDLRHLVALKAIADEGSFGRAAESLGYTQSAVSQQIAALERIVGLRLIERPGGPRPISLTEAGQILLRHADAIQARLLAAKADMAALEAGDAGRLRVGTFQSVGAKIIPRLLRRFSESHPQVEVVLRESQDEGELLQMIERGDLDLTFWTLPVAGGPYETLELLHDPYVLVVPAGSSLASAKRPPTLKEIVLQPIIGFNRCSAMDHVESQLASTGRAPNIVFRSDNNGTVQGLVGAGVGVAVSPRLTVDEDDPSIDVIDLQGRVPARVIGLVWHTDRHRSAAAEAFVDSATDVCRELSAESAAA